MDDRKLQILFSVIKNGSFSKAAIEQNCTQSAVTQMMNSLDRELGFPILKRSHNGTKLTDEGEKLLPYLIEAASSIKKLSEKATALHEGKTRYVRIGSFSSIANSWLPAIMKRYQELHPEIIFELKVGTQSLTEWLERGDIDLALGDEIRCRSSRWYPLTEDPYCALLPSSLVKLNQKSISQGELSAFPLIVAPENVLAPYFNVIAQKQIFVSCDDDSTLFALVASGIGVTVVPRLSLSSRSLPPHVKMLELSPAPRRLLGVAIAPGASSTASHFVTFLRRFYKKSYG